VVGVNKDVLAPDAFDNFRAGHQQSPTFDQQDEKFKGNRLEVHLAAGSAELVGTPVELEILKLKEFRRHLRITNVSEAIVLEAAGTA
jgi:hypothetical protein